MNDFHDCCDALRTTSSLPKARERLSVHRVTFVGFDYREYKCDVLCTNAMFHARGKHRELLTTDVTCYKLKISKYWLVIHM